MKIFVIALVIFCSLLEAELKHILPLNKARKLDEGSTCNDQIPAYMVVHDHKLIDDAQFLLKLRNITETSCKMACTDNENKATGKSILCASFSYSVIDQTCLIHTQKAKPVGRSELIPEVGHRYYEKFCLPITTPIQCGEANFFRTQSMVLEGFATKIIHTEFLDACLGSCIKENEDCKSAMFFYATGECILNSGSAADLPDAFVEEPKEKVIYFENGCVVEDQLRNQDKNSDHNLDESDTVHESEGAEFSRADTGDEEKAAALTETAKAEKKIDTPKLGPWSPWSNCDVPNGRTMRKRDCLSSDPERHCVHNLMETQWCLNNRPINGPTKGAQDEQASNEPKFFGSLRAKENDTQESIKEKSNRAQNELNTKWGLWSQICQPFTPTKPCDPHWRFQIGFQTRQCLDQQNTKACEGPFLRYCFIPC